MKAWVPGKWPTITTRGRCLGWRVSLENVYFVIFTNRDENFKSFYLTPDYGTLKLRSRLIQRNPNMKGIINQSSKQMITLGDRFASHSLHKAAWIKYAEGTLNAGIALSLPNSKRTFSQTFKEKCMTLVVGIGSIIIFHPSKLWKATFFILCVVICLCGCTGEIWNVSLLRVKGLKPQTMAFSRLRIGFVS